MLPFIGCINSQYVQENVTNGPFNVSMWGLEMSNCMETGEIELFCQLGLLVNIVLKCLHFLPEFTHYHFLETKQIIYDV